MAGIEQIVVHSKSYLVRWIQVPEYHSISWSCQPHKKGINFGIFKHPGTRNGLAPGLPGQDHVDEVNVPPTPAVDGLPKQVRRESVTNSNIIERLQNLGLKSVAWTGKCEADKVAMGRYDVPEAEGGTYGLVFDNTFSKQTSKNVTFVLITHPTNAPPKSGHHLHYAQAFGSGGASSAATSPALAPVRSSDSLGQVGSSAHRVMLEDPRPVSKAGHPVEVKGVEGNTFYTGILSKKRRKKGQGFAKRYFSLDFTSSTLSYYRDRHTSALRGAVPLALAAVGVNEKTREFSVDSGAEVWHLRALNKKDFEGWREALERASGTAASFPTTTTINRHINIMPRGMSDPQADGEWERIERLVSMLAGSRDAMRGLAKDTDPKYASPPATAGLGLNISGNSSNSHLPSPTHSERPTHLEPSPVNPYFPDLDDQGSSEKRPFWKRKPSVERSPSAVFRRSVSAQLAVPLPSVASGAMSPNKSERPRRHTTAHSPIPEADVHERCMALLHDLDSVVAQFTSLISESKARRAPPLPTTSSRLSLDSIDDQEFFDADDGGKSTSQLLKIRRDTESEYGSVQADFHHETEADSDSSSDADGPVGSIIFGTTKTDAGDSFPQKPESLSPLPLSSVQRRSTIAAPKHAPPSIIGFLRKNAGKDLSTLAMPVTANEPTSLLQRLAESVEYAALLDSAASSEISPAERLMYVSAFAISYFANNRAKERALRKPFNPMLGETFELVREDLGFRFLAEKVSHHPVRTACQAESLANGGWRYTQSPQPVQKFWGKSVELNTEGRARVTLFGPQERYSWSQATCFLRNVIAGEKYVEPVGTMTVTNESTGMRAVATFKSGGMFSGRSEEVTVHLFDNGADEPLPLGLTGKWTEGLRRTDTDASIWSVGSLVPDASKVYGFTTFAAALNETTDVEQGHLPPTDSRLRPDQQALETGEVDRAEGLKARLEERQRSRRKVLESHGQKWKPQFFEQVQSDSSQDADEEVWIVKQDQSGYWERREKNDWSGVQEVFEL